MSAGAQLSKIFSTAILVLGLSMAVAVGDDDDDDDDDDDGPRGRQVTVDCDRGRSLQKAIDRAKPGLTIIVKGTCREHVSVMVNKLGKPTTERPRKSGR